MQMGARGSGAMPIEEDVGDIRLLLLLGAGLLFTCVVFATCLHAGGEEARGDDGLLAFCA